MKVQEIYKRHNKRLGNQRKYTNKRPIVFNRHLENK